LLYFRTYSLKGLPVAAYPSSIITTATFTSKVNTVDIIDASHPNLIQDEIIAIETALGTTPAQSSAGSGSHTASSTNFVTVGARLNNIENGVLGDVHTQYVRKAADSSNVVTASTSSTKPLIVKGAASQSVSLQEWQNTSGTALASVSQAGNLTAASFVKASGTSSEFLKADGSVDSSTYATTSSLGSYLTTSAAATTYQPKFTLNATAKTAAYTLATGDAETMVQMNGAFAFTVGTGLSGLAVGTQIHLLALSSGVTVVGSGVTLNGTPGLKLRTAYSSATLICLASNNWVLIGDLSA
jgi:hypothetical protein